MRVTPRKGEIAEIVKLLETDGYDSADALAKDIIKRTAELFADREWVAWVWKETTEDHSFQLAWGPFPSESEAKKLASKVGVKGLQMFLPLASPGELARRVAEKPPAPWCSACYHPHHAHQHPKFNGRCAHRGCDCPRDAT